MRTLVVLAALLAVASPAWAARQLQQAANATAGAAKKCPAILMGHAVLPATTRADLPADLPAPMRLSGKFANANFTRTLTLNGNNPGGGVGPNSTWLPINGQPLQGFSGIKTVRNAAGNATGQFLVLQDNGYGNKKNSPDATLQYFYVTPTWANNSVKVDRVVFLRDPNRVIPFQIVNENTETRYLTGSDLDTESIQPIGDNIYIGDEFGPFIAVFNASTGVASAIYQVTLNGTALVSPDNPAVQVAAPGSPAPNVTVNRSKGLEGMAASPDGRFLYPLLEGPLYRDGAFENRTGQRYLRILKFDVQARQFVGNDLTYPLENNTNSIGDFNLITDRLGLIIERDDGQGDPAQGCNGTVAAASLSGPATCWPTPALFKRVYLVDLGAPDAQGFVPKLAYIDLLDIQDTRSLAPIGRRANSAVFTFPFITIEDVDWVSPTTIVVANDNNYPGSSGRRFNTLDDNEFIWLDVGTFLTGRC